MFNLFLICVFATSACLAVDFVPASNSRQNANPIAEWVHLYKQIFEPSNSLENPINLQKLRTVLAKMNSIEQNETYRAILGSIDGWAGYRINHYKNLVDQSYDANLLETRQHSITDLLLRTFRYEINDCTSDYFEILNEILSTFETSPISDILIENRKKQFINCWTRLMKSFVGSEHILGSTSRMSAVKLGSMAYPYERGIVLPSTAQSADNQIELVRIAKIIANYLKIVQSKPINQDFSRSFEYFIEIPCKLLIDATKHVVKHIHSILKFTGTSRDFISTDDILNLNAYIFCDRVMSYTKNIESLVMQNMNSNMALKTEENETVIDLDSETDEDANEDDVEDLDDEDSDDVNLITQHSFDGHLIATDEPEAKRQRLDPLETQAAIDNQAQQNNPQVNSHNLNIVEIHKNIGRGKATRYPVRWSDGSVTIETREDLAKNHSKSLNFHLKKMHSYRQNRYYSKKTGRVPWETDQQLDVVSRILDSPRIPKRVAKLDLTGPRRVVLVEKGPGIGRNSKYTTTWSDGTKTIETKGYLVDNWRDSWLDYIRYMGNVRKSKWLAKKRLKNKQDKQ